MNRTLRISLLSLLSAVAVGVMADEYSYEFTAKVFDKAGTAQLGTAIWTLDTNAGYFGYDGTKGQQMGSGNKPGKTIVLSTTSIPGTVSTVTVTTSGASSIAGTLNVTVGGTKLGSTYTLTSSSTETSFTGSGTGEIRLSYAQTSSKAIYIKAIKVVYSTDGSTPTPGGGTTPPATIETVSGIAAFNALPDGQEATLYLPDAANARVTHAYGQNAYLRDNSGALCLQGFDKTPAMAYNQHVAGYITGKKATVGDMPALTATDRTNTTRLVVAAPVTEPNVEPLVITAAEQSQHYADWVTIRDFTMADGGVGTDGTGQVKLVNTFRAANYTAPKAGDVCTVSGIVNSTASSGYRLSPVYNKATTREGNPTAQMEATFLPITVSTSITLIGHGTAAQAAVVYDIAGRRVAPAQTKKGLYIVNGKKMIK